MTDPAGAPVLLETDALDQFLVPTGTVATFEPASDGRHEVTIDSAGVGVATVTFAEPFDVFDDFFSSVWPLVLAFPFAVLGAALLVIDAVMRRRRRQSPASPPGVPQNPSPGSPSASAPTQPAGRTGSMSRRAYWAGLLALGGGLGVVVVSMMVLSARLGTIATVEGPASFTLVLEEGLFYDLELSFEDEGPNQLVFGISDVPGSRELVIIGPDGVERMRSRGLFASRSNGTTVVKLLGFRSDQAGRHEFVLNADRPMTVHVARTSIQQVGDLVPFLLLFLGGAVVVVGIVILAIGWVRARRTVPPPPVVPPPPTPMHQPPPPAGPNPT